MKKFLIKIFRYIRYPFIIYLKIVNLFIKAFDSKNMKKYYKNYNKDIYNTLSQRRKKSDTVFILGSGASVKDISSSQWNKISEHDTIAFNWFVYQNFLPIDYYIIKGIADRDIDRNIFMPQLNEFSRLIFENKELYKNTLFLLQDGLSASNTNRLLYNRMLPQFSHITRYISDVDNSSLSTSLPILSAKGSVLFSAINFALLLEYKNIVLVGVDLYNRDYFWLKDNEVRTIDLLRDATKEQKHFTTNKIIELLEPIIKDYSNKNVKFYTYNEKSLLRNIMEVYK